MPDLADKSLIEILAARTSLPEKGFTVAVIDAHNAEALDVFQSTLKGLIAEANQPGRNGKIVLQANIPSNVNTSGMDQMTPNSHAVGMVIDTKKSPSEILYIDPFGEEFGKLGKYSSTLGEAASNTISRSIISLMPEAQVTSSLEPYQFGPKLRSQIHTARATVSVALQGGLPEPTRISPLLKPDQQLETRHIRATYGNDLVTDVYVGREKPLGSTTEHKLIAAGIDPEALKQELRTRGIKILEVKGEDVTFLYAYDEKALQALIDKPAATRILTEAKWPTTAKEFVEHVSTVQTSRNSPHYDLVSDAFDALNHPNRLDNQTSKRTEYRRDGQLSSASEIPLDKVPPEVRKAWATVDVIIPEKFQQNEGQRNGRTNAEPPVDIVEARPQPLPKGNNAAVEQFSELDALKNMFAQQLIEEQNNRVQKAKEFAAKVDELTPHQRKILLLETFIADARSHQDGAIDGGAGAIEEFWAKKTQLETLEAKLLELKQTPLSEQAGKPTPGDITQAHIKALRENPLVFGKSELMKPGEQVVQIVVEGKAAAEDLAKYLNEEGYTRHAHAKISSGQKNRWVVQIPQAEALATGLVPHDGLSPEKHAAAKAAFDLNDHVSMEITQKHIDALRNTPEAFLTTELERGGKAVQIVMKKGDWNTGQKAAEALSTYLNENGHTQNAVARQSETQKGRWVVQIPEAEALTGKILPLNNNFPIPHRKLITGSLDLNDVLGREEGGQRHLRANAFRDRAPAGSKPTGGGRELIGPEKEAALQKMIESMPEGTAREKMTASLKNPELVSKIHVYDTDDVGQLFREKGGSKAIELPGTRDRVRAFTSYEDGKIHIGAGEGNADSQIVSNALREEMTHLETHGQQVKASALKMAKQFGEHVAEQRRITGKSGREVMAQIRQELGLEQYRGSDLPREVYDHTKLMKEDGRWQNLPEEVRAKYEKYSSAVDQVEVVKSAAPPTSAEKMAIFQEQWAVRLGGGLGVAFGGMQLANGIKHGDALDGAIGVTNIAAGSLMVANSISAAQPHLERAAGALTLGKITTTAGIGKVTNKAMIGAAVLAIGYEAMKEEGTREGDKWAYRGARFGVGASSWGVGMAAGHYASRLPGGAITGTVVGLAAGIGTSIAGGYAIDTSKQAKMAERAGGIVGLTPELQDAIKKLSKDGNSLKITNADIFADGDTKQFKLSSFASETGQFGQVELKALHEKAEAAAKIAKLTGNKDYADLSTGLRAMEKGAVAQLEQLAGGSINTRDIANNIVVASGAARPGRMVSGNEGPATQGAMATVAATSDPGPVRILNGQTATIAQVPTTVPQGAGASVSRWS